METGDGSERSRWGMMAVPSLESIVREYQGMVYRIAHNFSNSPSIAEEIAQDVFLEFVRRRPEVASRSHLKAWLRRVATHRSIDTLRRKGARPEIPMEVLPEVPVAHNGSDPLRDQQLRKLVRSLPEKQRVVIVLRFGEDLDVAEISRVLDIPSSTVRTQLSRALARMRERLASHAMESR